MMRLLAAALLLTFTGIQNTMHAEEIELLISQDEIKAKIAEVARTIDQDYQGEDLTMVMVMKGAICVAADLLRELKTPCAVEYVTASSYGQGGVHRGQLHISGLDKFDLTGKNVLLVDDIFDSGHTITQIMAKLQQKNPKSLKSLVLLAKNVKRDVTYIPDYILFPIENQFVIGFGLDYKEYYRGLPGVYIFKE